MVPQLLEGHLRAQAPKIEADLLNMARELLDQVSREEDKSPYQLSLLFKVEEGKLVAQVITQAAQEVYCLDAGGLFSELLSKQLKEIPEGLRGQVLEQLGGTKLEELLKSMLKENYLLVRYNLKEELELYSITAQESELVSLQDFFMTIEL